jgi:hypothetical protein
MNFVPLEKARMKLAIVWLGGGAVIILILVLQSLLHRYVDPVSGDLTQEAWGWLMPTILPTLGMIVTVLGYTALDPNDSKSIVRQSFLTLALSLSVFYVLLVLLTILIQPFASRNASDAIGLMRTSNLWLGPVQGLVASALGVLFVSKEKKDPAPPTPGIPGKP